MKESLNYLYHRVKKPGLLKEQAESKVCQEIFVAKLGSSQSLAKRVCFKGGLIIDHLAKGQRGYTKDIDFDLVKYPLSEEGLRSFFAEVSALPPYEEIQIAIDSIDELRHKNYQGKRLSLSFTDGESRFALTVDVGVHLPLFKKNEEFDYTVAFGGESTIFISPIERIIAEKLSTFAIYGTDNTRAKDLFDAYWIIKNYDHEKAIVSKMLKAMLVSRTHFFKNLGLAIAEIEETLSDKRYLADLAKSKKNWTNESLETIVACLKIYLSSL